MKRDDCLDAWLVRGAGDDQGTPGLFVAPAAGVTLRSLELPWRGNSTNVSCIPEGEYRTYVRYSAHWGERVHQLLDVPGRTAVQIHRGNVAGDESLGFRSHSHGCILLGLKPGELYGQRAVMASTAAIHQLMSRTARRPLRLTITSIPGGPYG